MVPVYEIFQTEFHMDFLCLPCVPSSHAHFPTELELEGFLTEPKFCIIFMKFSLVLSYRIFTHIEYDTNTKETAPSGGVHGKYTWCY
jgi:hypothetical protein